MFFGTIFETNMSTCTKAGKSLEEIMTASVVDSFSTNLNVTGSKITTSLLQTDTKTLTSQETDKKTKGLADPVYL